MDDWDITDQERSTARARTHEQFQSRTQRYGPQVDSEFTSTNSGWNDHHYELDVTHTQLDEARNNNAKLQSELITLRQDFARMQSQLANLNPSTATPLVQQW